MFENNITTAELISVLKHSEIIENYPDDFPCPSYLCLAKLDTTALHVVVANCSDHIRIVTVYYPYEEQWDDYRRRK